MLPPIPSRPAIPAEPARKATSVYRLGLGLAALLAGLLLLNNRQYLFHTQLFESSDWASDSLFVRDTEHHPMLHGHYSRWSFYHPGPILFYIYAFGETVFYRLCHLVPTPYNGQVIAICLAVTLFFSLALTVFAQRLGPERGGYTFFLPLALLFAVWHYGAADVAPAFLETWPACPPMLVFLCFVVATASTASGGGRELPLVALTGGWLVHNYVAQPLFVVPMTLLAYGGLLAWCRREGQRAGGLPPGPGGTLAGGWRTFPRAHLVAGGILALFILPVLIDLLHGSKSNFSHILTHMRRQTGPMNKFSRSWCYFLIFGSYSSYNPAENFFGKYTTEGMLAFIAAHWRIYLGWMTALLAVPVLFGAARLTEAAAPAGAHPERPAAERRSAFVPWFCVMSLLACALTLFWGMKQDGNMYYFNAYFDFSIYYCAALGLAAALAVFLQAVTDSPHLRLARVIFCAAFVFGAAVSALSQAEHFKARALDFPADRAAAQVVARAAAATLPPGGICYLDCDPWGEWPATIAIALQLDRLGYQPRVNDNWGVMFGAERTITHDPVDFSKPIARWTILPITRDPARLGRWPVLLGAGIQVSEIANLDPAGGSIRFSIDGNSAEFACFGWSPVVSNWTWSEQREALLQFRPLPLPADDAKGVDMVINAWAFTAPKYQVAQRLETVFNGVALATVRLPMTPRTGEPVKVHIDADVWRAAAAQGFVKVLFRFPDAKSPYAVGLNDDQRLLGGGFESIEFRLAR